MDIKIRLYKDEDKTQVIKLITSILKSEFDLEKETYADFDLKNIKDVYGGNRDMFLVAIIGHTIIGTIAVKEDDHNSALLRRIFVSSEFRGIGLGKKLIVKAIEFCEKKDYGVINFCSTDKMKAANNLCKRNGFNRRACMSLGPVKLLRFARKLRQTARSDE